MNLPQKRDLAGKFMLIGGVSWIVFGVSHLFFPSVLNWVSALSNVPPAHVFGIEISNVSFIYLFNADLFLYDMMLGLWSILFASELRKGKRTAATFGIILGAYFLIRALLQIHYFGTTPLDIVQAVAALAYAGLYLFPLTDLGAFKER